MIICMSIITIVKDVVQDYMHNKISIIECRNKIFTELQQSQSDQKIKSRIIKNLPNGICNNNLLLLKVIYDLDD